MAFRIGEAFVEIGLKDPTPADEERVRKSTEEQLARKPPKVPVKIVDPVNAAFRAKLEADLRAAARDLSGIPVGADTEVFRRQVASQIKAVEELLSVDIPMDVADAAKWRAKVAAEAAAVSQSVEAKIPVKIKDPVDAAFRAKLEADLRAAARDLTALPVNADTERFRRQIAAQIKLVEDQLSADVPMGVADAAKWRAKVAAEAAAVSQSVEAKIPVVIDEPAVKAAEGRLLRFAIGTAAVVGPSGLIGGALAGTSALFGGLAVSVAAGNEQVGREFGRLSDMVVGEFEQMSQGATRNLLRIEDTAEEAFGRLAPTIQRGITAAVPQLEILTNGVIGFTERAMPGMVTSIERADPVVISLSRGISNLGAGVSGFLEGLSSGAPGASAGLDTLLGGVAQILPPLGQLLGAWANVSGELLHNTAPAFHVAATVLGTAANVIDRTSGVLVPLATGALAVWSAWRLWSGITAITTRVSAALIGVTASTRAQAAAATQGAAANTAYQRSMTGARLGLGTLTAGLSIALPLLSAVGSQDSSGLNDFASALLRGGESAEAATKGLSEHLRTAQKLPGLADNIQRSLDGTKQALDEQLTSFGANADQIQAVNSAWDEYVSKAGDGKTSSDLVAVAFGQLNSAIAAAKAGADPLNSALGMTTDEFTQAAVEANKLDQELHDVVTSSAALTLGLQRQQGVQDAFAADISLRTATDATAQAQQNLVDVLKKHRAGSQAAKDASDQLLQAMNGQAVAARAAAEANYTGTDAEGRAAAGAAAYRQTLVNLSQHASGPLKAALVDTIAKLDQAAKPRTTDLYADITNATENIAKAKAQLNSVPASKRPKILADIADLQHKVALANNALESIHSKTIGINVNIVTHGNEIIVGKIGLGPRANASGSIVRSRRGGEVVQVAEAGDPEGIIPLNAQGAEFLRNSLEPFFAPTRQAPRVPVAAGQSPSTPAGGGGPVNNYYITINVEANQLSDMQKVINLFEHLPQAARAGGNL